MKLSVVRGSVLDQGAEAVVNAANTRMRGGGGIDGKVHEGAGPEMLLALRRLAPQGAEVAQPVVTPGFGLACRWVIHVAGPIWAGGAHGEPEFLAACYRNALLAADGQECASVAFCSISTGAFGFPIELAAPIALRTLRDSASELSSVREVIVALYGAREFEVFQSCIAGD